MKIDQVMIKEMLGAEQVGHYAAAVRLSEAWYFIPMAITSSVFPAIINAEKQSEELYYQRLQKLYDLMVWLAVAIALPTTFLAPWVIKVLYGEAFLPAAGVLSIHIWAGVFVGLGVASGRWFLCENMQKEAFYRTFLGAICNVVLNIIMIPKYGISGAAVSTLISQSIAAYFYDVLNHKTRGVFWMKTRSFNVFNKVNWHV
jgi:O-antigen/teichoic acid export membrane protein